MYPIVFSCSLFTVYSFGVCIFVGYLLYMWLLERDSLMAAYFSKNQLHSLVFGGLLLALVASRIFYFLGSPESFSTAFAIVNVADQQGGFSVMGAILGICIYAFFVYHMYRFPFRKVVDRCALYAPYLQACGRVGCFLAGCCYGVSLYPVQLHSAAMLFLVGCLLKKFHKRLERIPGRLTCVYLIAMSAERFFIDFWRGDRVFFSPDSLLSFDQYGALALLIISANVLLFLQLKCAEHHVSQ